MDFSNSSKNYCLNNAIANNYLIYHPNERDSVYGITHSGFINAGVYLMHSSVFDGFAVADKFSFENDFLQININQLKPRAYTTDCYFIDIGIPADYERAQQAFSKLN